MKKVKYQFNLKKLRKEQGDVREIERGRENGMKKETLLQQQIFYLAK